MKSLLLLFVIFFIVSPTKAQEVLTGVPTTPYLPEVFVGKCYLRAPQGVNCTALWEAFSAAAILDPRILTDADWAPYFAIADFSTPPNEALFWSSTKGFAERLANPVTNLTTLEETHAGYVMDGLSWCGTENVTEPVFDYTYPCPYEGNSSYYGMYRVWTQASAALAAGASGRVSVLLTPTLDWGTTDSYSSFRNTTIFATVEFPHMQVGKVTGFRILLLVTNNSFALSERCNSGSILTLQNMVSEKFGFEAECVDDQNVILDILCPTAQSDDSVSECMSILLEEMIEQEHHTNSTSSSSGASTSGLSSSTGGLPLLERYYLPWGMAMTAIAAICLVGLIAVSISYRRLREKQLNADREAAKSLLWNSSKSIDSYP